MHIVRYADDFKLFCRKRSDAEKVFIAVKLWLQDRLKLEISEEKSKIVNLKRHYSEFLGFEMKAVKKRKRYVVKSHMTEKAISKEKAALIEQVKQIAHVQDRDASRIFSSLLIMSISFVKILPCWLSAYSRSNTGCKS